MADMQALERLKQKYKAQGMSDADAQAQAERDTADLPGPLSSLSKSVASEIYSATPKAPTFPKPEPGIPAEASANKARPEELDSLAAKLKAKQAQEQAPPPSSGAGPGQGGPKPPSAKAGTGASFEGKEANQFRSRIQAMMEGTDDKEIKTKAAELDKAHADLMAQYKKDKTALDWGRVGEMLGRALTQLAAGAWGAKNNVDLSNLKGEKWDWKQDFDNLLEQTKMESSDIEKRRNINEKEREALDRRKERQQGLKAGAEETIYKEGQRAKERAAEKTERTSQKADELLDRRRDEQRKEQIMQVDQRLKELDSKKGESLSIEEAKKYANSVGLPQLPPATKTVLHPIDGVIEADALIDAINRHKEGINKRYWEGRGISDGGPATSGGSASKKDPQVEQYAQQYTGGDYNKALEILRKRGYQPK